MLGESSVKTLVLLILLMLLEVLKLVDPDFPDSFQKFILADSPTTAAQPPNKIKDTNQ